LAAPISSNWAYDHINAADPHTVYRLESADHSHQSTGAQAGQLDHGLALTGLADDDHVAYIRHNTGRSTPNIIVGGTGAGDNLTFYSTSHGTKGNIFFGTSTYDEVNNRLGINILSPLHQLHVSSSKYGIWGETTATGSSYAGVLGAAHANGSVVGVYGYTTSVNAGAIAVRGYAADQGYAGYFASVSGVSVYSTSAANYAVSANTTTGRAINGVATSAGYGVYAASATGTGLYCSGHASGGGSGKAAFHIAPQAVAPTVDVTEGDVYMNGTDHKLYVYNGSTWNACW
jgi:hypothetical protein